MNLKNIARPSVAESTAGQIVDQVKNHIGKNLLNSPKLPQIAAILGQSERSLQLQLKQQGTSYQQLLADVRLHHAQDYLQYSKVAEGESWVLIS